MAVDAQSLCAIIRTCHKSGVSSLKFEGIEVTFGTSTQTQDVGSVPHETLYTGPVAVPDRFGEKSISMELASEQQKLLEDAELVDMQISDPVSFEAYSIDCLVHGDRSLDA